MEYSKIIAVTGLPGLYELLSNKTDGAIVRSLEDKSTRFVSSRIHSFSHLESIEVYTVKENVNLIDILKAMETSSENLPDEKDPEGLKKYFKKTVPDLDFERVYSSDLKKMVKWFSVLKTNDIEFKVTKAEEPVAEEPVKKEPAKAKEKQADKPKKELKQEKEPKPEKEAKEAAPAKKPVKKKKVEPKKEPVEKEKPKKAAPKKKSAK
jgi:cell division septation protein DedD